MRKQFPDVSSKYGAPMGRRESGDAPKGKIYVFRVRPSDGGDYDDGGAYWGGLKDSPLYCARGASVDGDGFERYTRAKSRKEAIDKMGLQNAQLTERPDAYDFAAFVEGYIACALWASLDDAGSALDNEFDVDDFTQKARAEMRRDCRAFIRANLVDLQTSGQSAEQSGHDFWLARNGHGAGFWDRGLGEIGERLTKASKTYGSADLYVHRKRIHHS